MGIRYIPPGKKSLKRPQAVAPTEAVETSDKVVVDVVTVVEVTAVPEAQVQVQVQEDTAEALPLAAETQLPTSSDAIGGTGLKRKR